ncbi:MAG: NAD-dependent epimerase/dehydratase family protein [Gemmatimonadota bacterium]
MESEGGSGYAGARVIVLGATGFIGRWVARRLCEAGADVHLFVRSLERAEALFAAFGVTGTYVQTDLSEVETLRRQLRELRPSVTFNLAGYGVDRAERDEATAWLLNSRLVGVLCGALRTARDSAWPGAAIVHAGSALEYGRVGGHLSETGPARPSSLYGRAKLAGTLRLRRLCRGQRLPGVTARLFSVYGPGEHANRLLPSLVRLAGTEKSLPLTAGLQRRDFTYVEDVAEGLIRLGLARAEPGEVVNLATGKLTTVRRFCTTACAALSVSVSRLRFGELPTRPEEMAHDPVSVERLRRLTNWCPQTPVPEGIARTIEFESRFGRFPS